MIPAQTNRAHLKARDPRCDTVKVLNMAARRRPGRRYADMNACAGLEDDWNLHYPDSMGKNHFTHIIDAHTGKRRQCTPLERAKRVQELPSATMRRYRKQVGRKWVRPFTVAERNRQARRRRVRICWELKSRMYGRDPKLAMRFVGAIKATGWTSYYMTLITMWGWAQKLQHFKMAGGETALLVHGHARTAVVKGLLTHYAKYIDRYWGRWA